MALQNKEIAAAGSNGHHNFILYVSEHSTNIANNTSSIGWTLQMTAIQNGWNWDRSNAMSWSVSIAGKSYSGTLAYYDGKSTITLGSDTFNVAHNADGNKSINFSFNISSLNYSYLPGSASKSDSLTLTYIPRVASITSAPNFNDTEYPTISYSNPAGNALLVGAYICKNDADRTNMVARWISATGTSYTFSDISDTERLRLRNNVVSGTSATVIFKVITYNQNYEAIGSTELQKTYTLTNATPTLSPSIYDTLERAITLTGDANKIIKGYNNMYVATGATARKGATISSQKITSGSQSITTATGYLSNVESGSFLVEAKDSRNNVVNTTINKTLINYKNLTCNLAVNAPTTSGEMSLTISGNYWSGNFGAVENTLTVEYRIKVNESGWGAWTPITPTINASNGTYEVEHTLTSLNYLNTYTIQARAIDAVRYEGIESVEKRVKTKPVFDWSETDFNFNVPVAINGIEQDYIVEQGSSGIWTYRKWNSGKAECWGRLTHSTIINTAWGSMYVGGTKTTKTNYPFQFSATPVETATIQAANYAAWLYAESGATGYNSSTQTAVYNVCRPTSGGTGTHTFYISLYVVGRWK